MLLRSPKIHIDDTIIPVLKQFKTHNGRLWTYIGGGGSAPTSIVYRYSKTRSGKEPKKYLKGYRVYLQADAYSGYDHCYESDDIIEVGCMAHARRKMVDASQVVQDDTLAMSAISQIKELYGIEAKVKPMSDEQRYYYRRRHTKPKLKKLYKWLLCNQSHAQPKSPLGKAINYMLNHLQAFNNYLRDGVLQLETKLSAPCSILSPPKSKGDILTLGLRCSG